MLITATIDVPDGQLNQLASDLSSVTQIEVSESRRFFKAAAAPSWIALLSDPPAWIALLGVPVTIFLGELIKEAAKDSWRNKQRVGRVLAQPVLLPLRSLASSLARFRSEVPERTEIEVGFPIPDAYFGTRLSLSGHETEEFAFELAVFVHHTSAIQHLLKEIVRQPTVRSGRSPLRCSQIRR
jgi:hypothetical protein